MTGMSRDESIDSSLSVSGSSSSSVNDDNYLAIYLAS
jgi:hypothetical protein